MTHDVIVFPVIDWAYRFQRPQQIAFELARRGHRVFYLTTQFASGDIQRPYLFWASPAKNVYIVQLRCSGTHPNIYKQLPTLEQSTELIEALNELRLNCQVANLVTIVDLPFWHRIAMALQGSLAVYDCMDYHPGFLNNEKKMLDEEDKLIENADLLLTASGSLTEMFSKLRPNKLIRNACEFEHFRYQPGHLVHRMSNRPVVGYHGAIDHWYDMDLVIKSARAYPEWDFVLIGRTHGCDIREAEAVPNIKFLGEIRYQALPGFVHGFDIGIIPFKISDLTLHTNPVKMYEYLAAGKPMVGTAMPEIMIGGEGLVYVANDHDEFIVKLADAMTEHDNPIFIERRISFARGQTWPDRVDDFLNAVSDYFPRVSVVVLTYNNLDLTKKCLASIERNDDYPNLELIIVDNASTDGSSEWLYEYASTRRYVRFIGNDENFGFAGGNNLGMRAATGDYIVLLNNDTQVTQGWLFDLLRHFRRDPALGLLGPVTNNIGNEARVEIPYSTDAEMSRMSREYVQQRRLARMEMRTVAFFCVMIRRAIYEEVGDLDEDFKVGMFEDDDYCRRVQMAGYKIGLAEDVFIHHELSASLSALGAAKRQELFEQNKRVYEKKWGKWIPHQYRKTMSA